MTNPPGVETTSNAPETQEGPEGAGLLTFIQPFYNLRTNELQGVEALARRCRPDGRDASLPDGVGTVRSATDLRAIDRWIIDDALGHVTRWGQALGRPLTLSVNLSGEFVHHPDCVVDVLRPLRRHSTPGHRFLVDLSTSIFRSLHDGDERALARIKELQHDDVTFCVDGFTADDLDLLPTAAEFPVDIIKLHPRQFADGRDGLASIAKAVQALGLPVVAAGVETREQLQMVRDLDFEWAQGFLLGEPVEAGETLPHPLTLSEI